MVESLVVAQGLGAALTDGDVESIRAALEAFLIRSLLPALQSRVRSLHFQVSAASFACWDAGLHRPNKERQSRLGGSFCVGWHTLVGRRLMRSGGLRPLEAPKGKCLVPAKKGCDA